MIHVVPIADTREHDRERDCWCAPRIEWHATPLVIHNAADGRVSDEETGFERLPWSVEEIDA